MKLPKKIKIISNDYEIKLMSLEETKEGEYFGRCSNNHSLIRIDPGWNDQTQARTLLHEIIHALGFMMNIKFKGEEKTVEPLANGLAAVMRDNPKLFQDIQKALK